MRASLYYKMIIETLIGRPLDKNTQSNQVHTCQADQKAWVDSCREELMSEQ